MNFPYGKAALSILLLAVLSGAWLAAHPPVQTTATLTMWTFAKPHFDAYQTAAHSFEAEHPGVTVNLQLVSNNALASRLQAAFLADLDVPDLCEIEISTAGTMFRGPLKDIGWTDLTDKLHQTGLYDRMVQARFAPYTSRGRIFGLPHDVHPVQMAYRRDIFEKLGIDTDQIKTWDDFIRIGRKVTLPGKRYLWEAADSNATQLEPCLFQRGGGYFNPAGKVIFDNEIAVETMKWYVPIVAGPHKIGNDLGGGQILTKAVEDGYLLCLIAPDWRTKSIETDIPRMAGKMALMPLPAVAPGQRPTSTWGGTMLGITKHCKNQELAWAFAQHLYTDKSQLAERFAGTNILPALKEAWDQPAFREKRAYWSNQPLGATYARLAPDVPFQYTSPFISTAKGKFSQALVACVRQYNARGEDGFDAFVRAQLKRDADEVRAMIARNPY